MGMSEGEGVERGRKCEASGQDCVESNFFRTQPKLFRLTNLSNSGPRYQSKEVCASFWYCFLLIVSVLLFSDPIESMLTVFGMLTLTSWTARSAARQLVLWWLVFVLLLTATYSSGIAARLTKPQYELRIDTIQQLVDADFHWYSNNVTDDLKNYVLNMAVRVPLVLLDLRDF